MEKERPTTTDSDDDIMRRKKRRNVGSFNCSKCSKVFTRSDHLARHYLNHQPKQVYVCEFPVTNHNGSERICGKTFVRKDLRERHYRRHLSERKEVSSGSELSAKREDSIPPPSDESEYNQAQVEHSETPGSHVHPNSNLGSASSQNKENHGKPANAGGPLFRGDQSVNSPTPHLIRNSHDEVGRAESRALPHLSTLHGPQAGAGHDSRSVPHKQNYIGRKSLANPIYQEPHYLQTPSHVYQHQPLSTLSTSHQMMPQMPTASHPDHQFHATPLHQYANHMSAQNSFSTISPSSRIYPSMGPPPLQREATPITGTGDSFLGPTNFVQSQNDVLSWLFADNPQDFSLRPPNPTSPSNSSIISESFQSISPYQASQQNHHIGKNPISRASNVEQEVLCGSNTNSPEYYASNQMLNAGLHDLNYFSKNENPLDEILSKFQNGQTEYLSGDKRRVGTTITTNSTSSPTNTNDTGTPHSVSDIYVNSINRGTIEERLPHHLLKMNIEKNKHLFLNKALWSRIMSAVPEVSIEELEGLFAEKELENRMSFYLYGFWETFHRRFSILHKPSFSTSTAEPLLLLSMLMVGCMYCATAPVDIRSKSACAEYKLCMLVAEPLRFKLFRDPAFKCPTEVWVLQSLNLLEWCEKNYLSRDMHERAHVHHGTTVQLLRRSPFLGGNPTVKNKSNSSANENSTSGSEEDNPDNPTSDLEDQSNDDQNLFRKWVESESMKRITFMTFYLDTVDYIKFRHNPQIPFFQLQLLNLPCDEETLWNSHDINGSFKKLVKRQKKLTGGSAFGVRGVKDFARMKPGMNFLSALKKLLRSHNSKTSFSQFTRSILFAGIVSIMHQMQQTELESKFSILSSGTEKSKNSQWKEVLVKALDEYESDFHSAANRVSSDPFFGIEEFQCKFPLYHLVSIIGISDINHYDIAILSGSPRNMSVEVSSKDVNIVKQKLKTVWDSSGSIRSFNDLVNVRAVIHSFWLLWSLMLYPLMDDGEVNETHKFYNWDADHDCYDTMYAVSIATMVIWCYSYSRLGPESASFKDLEDRFTADDQKSYEKLSSFMTEDGYAYLLRTRDEFAKGLKTQGPDSIYCIHQTGTNRNKCSLYESLKKHCELLPTISGLQNLSGLCFLVGTKLYRSQWEIVRENAKLILNCGLRSVGKSTWQCMDVFDSDFPE